MSVSGRGKKINNRSRASGQNISTATGRFAKKFGRCPKCSPSERVRYIYFLWFCAWLATSGCFQSLPLVRLDLPLLCSSAPCESRRRAVSSNVTLERDPHQGLEQRSLDLNSELVARKEHRSYSINLLHSCVCVCFHVSAPVTGPGNLNNL